MSLQPQPIDPVPEETIRVARAAFLKGNLYITLRDEIGTLYSDFDFAALYPTHGQPTVSPWRLNTSRLSFTVDITLIKQTQKSTF